jgi:hypothetical protein
LNYKNLNGKELSVTVLKRPHLTTFIKYILDNSKYFNLGFFTTMNEEQAYGAYNMLQKIRKFKPYIFVCFKSIDRKYPTSEDNYEKKFKTYHYYDILNKKVLDIPILNDYYNRQLDVNILINHPDFKDKLHPDRTIFIHRSVSMNQVSSIKNTIPVIIWDTSMTCDDTLKKVSEWLEKHKETKSFKSITLPNFVVRSPFTKIKYPHNTKFYDRTASKICKTISRIQRKKKTDVSKTKKRKH